MHRAVHLKNKISLTGILVKISILFVIPVLLIILPNSLVFKGQTICLINNIFGINCFGCGMTRAIFLVFDGDFNSAFNLNAKIILVFPILFLHWIKLVYKQILAGLQFYIAQVK